MKSVVNPFHATGMSCDTPPFQVARRRKQAQKRVSKPVCT